MGFLDSVFLKKAKRWDKGSNMLDETASELSLGGTETQETYSQKGVKLENATHIFKLCYNGLLARNGAVEVSLMVGYGDQNQWKDTDSYLMKKLDNQMFEVYFPAVGESDVQLAFKDNAGNWDNNSGQNYTFIKG